jgi:hypothetical protein
MMVAFAITAHAQITNPNDLVTGPPKPPKTRDQQRPRGPGSGSLQWLWQYAQPEPNGNAVALRNDDRFEALLQSQFKQPQAFWGKQVPLADVIPRFLSRYGEINSRDNRYWIADGCVPSFCAAHGMLWIDLGQPSPLLVFAAVNWTTEGHTTDEANADYNLWLFTSRQLSADALPFALTTAISGWDARLAQAHRGVPHIAHAILVEPDGHPYPLNPAMAGANTLPPQPDTVTPKSPDSE